IESLQDLHPSYAWVGLTDAEGTVMEGSDDLREGHSVVGHTWFAAAREGHFIGDVYEASLLTTLLGRGTGSQSEPLRLVDVAAPVIAADGRLAGVLGAHIHWDWAHDLRDAVLTSRRREMQTELRVLDREGRLILGGS